MYFDILTHQNVSSSTMTGNHHLMQQNVTENDLKGAHLMVYCHLDAFPADAFETF